ncbi:MAG: 23S rRNA (pseudouridine(1915)-N(3))-methyltransferase RlmH [Flavobacteriales bacterium]|nr:23S rRNA (pseudouridine(1915)-N(3))-methyltransferase RlmH [Flavobacteriales bacterium]
MQIRIICIGTLKETRLWPLLEEYIKRVKRYNPTELLEVAEKKDWKKLDQDARKKVEAEAFLSVIRPGDLTVRLDERGKTFSSEELAAQLQKWMNSSPKSLNFLVGGAFGFSDELKKAIPEAVSLSKLTFTHDMVRLFLLEQLYRAFTILHGEPYHHE